MIRWLVIGLVIKEGKGEIGELGVRDGSLEGKFLPWLNVRVNIGMVGTLASSSHWLFCKGSTFISLTM